jgi:putative transcriptional regulator
MTNKVRFQRFICGEMSQSLLAEKVGVSRQTIAAIEKGNYSPSVWLAIRLAKVFQANVESIFILEEGQNG